MKVIIKNLTINIHKAEKENQHAGNMPVSLEKYLEEMDLKGISEWFKFQCSS